MFLRGTTSPSLTFLNQSRTVGCSDWQRAMRTQKDSDSSSDMTESLDDYAMYCVVAVMRDEGSRLRKLGHCARLPRLADDICRNYSFLSTIDVQVRKTRLQFQAEATSKCTYPHLLPKRARIQRAVERGVAAHRIAYHEAGPKNPSHVFAFMGLHGVLAACMQVQGAGQRLQAVWFIDAAAQT